MNPDVNLNFILVNKVLYKNKDS